MTALAAAAALAPSRCSVDGAATAEGRREDGLSPAAPRCVVIDTNCVLDLWLFADPRVADLRQAVLAGAVRWIATPTMRVELERVLGYPAIVRQCALRGVTTAVVLEAFDRHTRSVPAAAAAPMRCSDPDDQVFIDLAVAWRADLYSRDHAVRALARRLGACGTEIRPRLQPSGGTCRRQQGAY